MPSGSPQSSSSPAEGRPHPGLDLDERCGHLLAVPHRLLVPSLLLLTLAACGSNAERPSAGLRIAVVPKGSTHEHWLRVKVGAERAAAEFTRAGTPVEVIWKAPLREDDREQQVQVVEGFISQGVDGLVLAPLDSRASLNSQFVDWVLPALVKVISSTLTLVNADRVASNRLRAPGVPLSVTMAVSSPAPVSTVTIERPSVTLG